MFISFYLSAFNLKQTSTMFEISIIIDAVYNILKSEWEDYIEGCLLDFISFKAKIRSENLF